MAIVTKTIGALKGDRFFCHHINVDIVGQNMKYCIQPLVVKERGDKL